MAEAPIRKDRLKERKASRVQDFSPVVPATWVWSAGAVVWGRWSEPRSSGTSRATWQDLVSILKILKGEIQKEKSMQIYLSLTEVVEKEDGKGM